MSRLRKVVVSIYIHPEFYPPTINAILCLSEVCDEVIVVTRNNSQVEFPFPANVKVYKTGEFCTPYNSERQSTIKKVFSFVKFTGKFFQQSVKSNVDLVLLYDAIPLFSFYLGRILISKKVRIWYHNHDMPNISSVRKFSIGWFSSKYEEAAMRYINLFSLPSLDRLRYYPWLSNSLPFYYLPNFPSLKVYKQRNDLFLPEGKIRLIFQGSLGEGHALEEILELMQEKIEGRTLELVLKGPVRDAYKKKLSSLAEVYGVVSRVYWHGIGPYVDLPELTKTCHIGIAIYMGKDEVSKTLGTASNKIYEYAACGLPVLLFDNEQFRKNLANVDWAYFTDGKKESLKAEIVNILKGWADKSKSGRVDFEHTYNFEIHFTKLIKSISLAE